MPQPNVTLTRRGALAAACAALAAPAVMRGLVGPAAASPVADRPLAPPFRRFRLGSFVITVVSDGGAMVDGPWPIVGEDRPKEEVERLMRDNLLPPSRFWPGFSPIVIDTGAQKILLDTGNGSDGFIPRPAAGRLAENLNAAGFATADIDIVALTHCHSDHIGGVMEGTAPLFPNARYVVGAVEYAFWTDPARLSAPEGGNELKSAKLFVRTMPQLADRTTFIKAGDEVVAGMTALAAYGHTPGHFGFHIESGGKRLLAWGDCAHHEVASLAHPEWSALFDMDKEQGKATRRAIYDMAATERLPVIGYHTSFPSLGFVERTGAGFRWTPETYQLAE